MRCRRLTLPLVAVLALGGLLGACGSDDGDGSSGPQIRRVGSDYDTIQAAVDAAEPGDLILIAPGTYEEAVKVYKPRLVIRGEDRNTVVLDGRNELLNGFEVTADRVAIENLTVQDYAINGVIFTSSYGGEDPQAGPVGWRASYVTASNNGLYGLYAFGTGAGQFDHNHASGHPDSGIYVGQCRDCGAVVRDNVMEHNAIGYENTNASGVTVAANTMRGNRVGMTINSATSEELAPQRGGDIVANLVVDNDDPDTPETRGGFGVGIALAGGTGNRVSGNVVRGHPGAGIVLVDQEGFLPEDNTIEDNTLADNGLDLVFASEAGLAPEAGGNCVTAPAATTSRPASLVTLLACGRSPGSLPATALDLPDGPKGVSPDRVPRPDRQPNRPGSATRWNTPSAAPKPVDLDQVTVPDP